MSRERRIIDSIRALLGRSRPGLGVIVGPGDDAAVVKMDGQVILTCDSLVEGTHFLLDSHSAADLGWKSLAINLSDVAAMGGIPRFCLVSLILRDDVDDDFITFYYDGLCRLSDGLSVSVVGGNLARTEGPLVFDVSVVGEIPAGCSPLRLDGARVGDLLLVTGDMGASRAGLEVISQRLPREDYKSMVSAHLRPVARVREARVLAENARRPSAVTDISDGLSQEIAIMCAASGVGALVHAERVPVRPEVSNLADYLNRDPLEWVLAGGEEYELLFACAEKDAAALATAITETTGTQVTVIGEIRSGSEGIRILARGQERDIPEGFTHFRAT